MRNGYVDAIFHLTYVSRKTHQIFNNGWLFKQVVRQENQQQFLSRSAEAEENGDIYRIYKASHWVRANPKTTEQTICKMTAKVT